MPQFPQLQKRNVGISIQGSWRDPHLEYYLRLSHILFSILCLRPGPQSHPPPLSSWLPRSPHRALAPSWRCSTSALTDRKAGRKRGHSTGPGTRLCAPTPVLAYHEIQTSQPVFLSGPLFRRVNAALLQSLPNKH